MSASLLPFVVPPFLLAVLTAVAGYLPARRLLLDNPIRALGHE